MKKIICLGIFGSLVLATVLFSCQKDAKSNNGQSSKLKVYLTDAPGSYNGVFIDVKDVQINMTSDSVSGWQSLSNVATGTYNLMDLVNGNDTLLADSDVPTGGTISQVRLILGSNNYVDDNGNMINMSTPSAQQSGLKINVHQRLDSGLLYNLVLDFDAARSIVKTGNSKYLLKPAIRGNFQLDAGRIKGVVTPDTVTTSVFAIQGTDTSGTLTDAQGNYLIGGLSAGSYDLYFKPSDTSFADEQRTGINVSLGTITVVDTVHLHQ